MVDLLRYIELAFPVPAPTPSTSAGGFDTVYQQDLKQAAQGDDAPERMRVLSDAFLSRAFSSAISDPLHWSEKYTAVRDRLSRDEDASCETVAAIVRDVFDMSIDALVRSDSFVADRDLLKDTVVAVKLVTGFDRVNAAAVVSMLQVVSLIEECAYDEDGRKKERAAELLNRPVTIPDEFLAVFKRKSSAQPPPPEAPNGEAEQVAQLRAERDRLASTYDALMSLRPAQLEVATESHRARAGGEPNHGEPASGTAGAQVQFLRIGEASLEAMGDDASAVFSTLGIDPRALPITDIVEAVKERWTRVGTELAPAEVPGATPVYRLGGNVFAVRDQPAVMQAHAAPAPGAPPVPDFSHAITRPVGVGDLQVVRQKLIGYEAGEISHIENVLSGELLRRSTRREELNELTVTEESATTQSEERDQQSTDRHELASEIQKETSQQTVSSADQTTSTDYGKLVENSKTNYARSVTERAASSVTQMVKQQRVLRERKTFTEEALHELDNRRRADNVKGIYQWVDKKYNVRVLNYGKRLLYDVVVPEPAAFLIQSLKDAVQPEGFQLVKPTKPWIQPTDLDTSNYQYYAALYGVTGSVSPPPDEFVQTVAHPETAEAKDKIAAFGSTIDKEYFAAFTIDVTQDYKAIGGYVEHANVRGVAPLSNPSLEFFIGESTFLRFDASGFLNKSFTLNGESGSIPVTVRSFDNIVQFAYAVAINCRRTDRALRQWQLTTHAAIIAGYQRQLADYEDKLARYTAAVRAQMAATANFAHDPTIEQQELKKAFTYLLLAEHWPTFLPTPPYAPSAPTALPPDPVAVKKWGAMVAFFERAFEWENVMYTYYPYYWGQPSRWEESILIQDVDPQFEAFLKAGAARVVIPTRPGFEAALAHYHETGDLWLGEEIPDMFSQYYVSIINEIKGRNYAQGSEICVSEWEVKLPTTLVMLRDDTKLPHWKPDPGCGNPPAAPPPPHASPPHDSFWTWLLKLLGLKS
jgi:hypothetical protein